MFKWRYQAVKQPQSQYSKEEFFYEIHEVYLEEDNEAIGSMTVSPVRAVSFTDEEEKENPTDEEMKQRLIEQLEMMIEDVKNHPVFIPPAEWDKKE